VRLGVVVPCHRQERFLPRTVAALERALAGHDWRGVLVLSAPGPQPRPALSERWQVIAPPVSRPLTPGAARMLGFAACGGRWVLFPDADIEVEPAWLERAVATASAEPALAGIGGRIDEWYVDRAGERPGSPDMHRAGRHERRVDHLAGLAFYRREALLAAGGYDARLRSEEDFELGLRLRGLGLELRSLGILAARHWSAPRPNLAELGRRWRAGLCFGQGQVLRLYLGRPGFGRLVRRQALYIATLGLWALGVAALARWLTAGDPLPLAAWGVAALGGLALMGARKRSLRLGLYSLLTWTLNGLGMLVGLWRPLDAGDGGAAREGAC